MKCEVYPLDKLQTYKYVVVFARYKGQWLFVKHTKRSTWETAGGHIEPGETPLEAAKRELYEESGAITFSIEPVCDYWASDEPYEAFPPTEANGVVFLARIRELGPIPDPVMEKTGLFDGLPENLTYPGITPVIFKSAQERLTPYYFTHGDIEESLSIMRESAQWLISIGKPMWLLSEFDRDAIKNPPEDFLVMYDDDGNGIATLLLSFVDKFFWPDIPEGESGFIHKLSVRREFAGGGFAEKLIKYAASICKEKGILALRLDCDSNRKKLCAFYERAGFELIEVKTVYTLRFGKLDISYYKLDIV